MTLYIIKNERNEEVAAYTDQQHARLIAEELAQATLQQHQVEELLCETAAEKSTAT